MLFADQQQLLDAVRQVVATGTRDTAAPWKVDAVLNRKARFDEYRQLVLAGVLAAVPRVSKAKGTTFLVWRPRDEQLIPLPCAAEAVRANVDGVLEAVRPTEGPAWYADVRDHFLWFDWRGNDLLEPLVRHFAQANPDYRFSDDGTRFDRADQFVPVPLPVIAEPPDTELSDDDFRLLNALEEEEARRINFGAFETTLTPRLAGVGTEPTGRRGAGGSRPVGPAPPPAVGGGGRPQPVRRAGPRGAVRPPAVRPGRCRPPAAPGAGGAGADRPPHQAHPRSETVASRRRTEGAVIGCGERGESARRPSRNAEGGVGGAGERGRVPTAGLAATAAGVPPCHTRRQLRHHRRHRVREDGGGPPAAHGRCRRRPPRRPAGDEGGARLPPRAAGLQPGGAAGEVPRPVRRPTGWPPTHRRRAVEGRAVRLAPTGNVSGEPVGAVGRGRRRRVRVPPVRLSGLREAVADEAGRRYRRSRPPGVSRVPVGVRRLGRVEAAGAAGAARLLPAGGRVARSVAARPLRGPTVRRPPRVRPAAGDAGRRDPPVLAHPGGADRLRPPPALGPVPGERRLVARAPAGGRDERHARRAGDGVGPVDRPGGGDRDHTGPRPRVAGEPAGAGTLLLRPAGGRVPRAAGDRGGHDDPVAHVPGPRHAAAAGRPRRLPRAGVLRQHRQPEATASRLPQRRAGEPPRRPPHPPLSRPPDRLLRHPGRV